MSITAYTIVVKGELTSLNDYTTANRESRYSGAQLKKDNDEYVMWQTKGLEKLKHYPVHVHIHWVKRNYKIDPDNTAFAKKFILDALVKNKILRNDGHREIEGFSDSYEIDFDNPKMIITLTYKPKRI